jgi:hypothetical protein
VSEAKKTGGIFSRFFGGVEHSLPTPRTGTDTFPKASARRGDGMQSKAELERSAHDGTEVENLVRMPGWLRYYRWLCDSKEKCLNQLARDDFGAQNDRLKAVQLRLATLEECLRWAEEEIAAGKLAAEELIGGK